MLFSSTHVRFFRIEYVMQQITRSRLGKASHCKFYERDVFANIIDVMDVPEPSMLSMPMLTKQSRRSQSHRCHGKETDRSPRASPGTRTGRGFHLFVCAMCSLPLVRGGFSTSNEVTCALIFQQERCALVAPLARLASSTFIF